MDATVRLRVADHVTRADADDERRSTKETEHDLRQSAGKAEEQEKIQNPMSLTDDVNERESWQCETRRRGG